MNKKTGFPVLFSTDIQELDWIDVLKKVGLKRGECDLLLGSPPCQGFSAHRINDAGVDDPRNELLASYFDSVEALQPAVFLIETVPGLLWKRHDQYLKQLEAAGWDVLVLWECSLKDHVRLTQDIAAFLDNR